MSTLMMPAATMTTMTNTTPIAVTQPKAPPPAGVNSLAADPAAAKMAMINNNKQGRKTPTTFCHTPTGEK